MRAVGKFSGTAEKLSGTAGNFSGTADIFQEPQMLSGTTDFSGNAEIYSGIFSCACGGPSQITLHRNTAF